MTRPVAIIVRDGWGHNPDPAWDHANAIVQGHTPVNDRLLLEYPHTQIHTSGEDVGLPAGVMGNSEVGHQNIGAGRIVDQEVMRITRAIRDGSLFENPVLLGAFDHASRNNGSVHVLGLCSDGRVHSDLDHAKVIIDLAGSLDFPPDRFFFHAITDGRDTSPRGGLDYVRQIIEKLDGTGIGRVASVIGRYYAMDRDNRWDRVEMAYRMLTEGSPRTAASATEAIQDYYDDPSDPSRAGDEFVHSVSITHGGIIEESQKIKTGDAVIFFNYRGDRPREICKAFTLENPEWSEVPNGGFRRGEKIDDLYFAGMTGYEKGLPIRVIFEKPPRMQDILGEYISQLGIRQFRCVETEKFPHVTFFFNDYRDDPFEGEDREVIPSPRDVTTYDQKPEMAAHGVLEAVMQRIAGDEHDLYVINFANPDMVGHTGVLEAAVKAVETVDECVGKIVDAILEKGGAAIVTADHGNCEQMIDPMTGGAHTAHTLFDVDLIVVDDRIKGQKLKEGGRLADIAPTALALLGLGQPEAMAGQCLIELPPVVHLT
jgi:2,3-bisphosphoglycerate-independent phosphoglycerate mutase